MRISEGYVVRVTRTQIKTSAGHTYRRRGLTGVWKRGSWSLITGDVNKLNPEV